MLRTIVIFYAVFSTLAVIALGWDKFAAKQGWRRIAEVHLHWIELLGGWPGSLLGQQVFRHKRSKARFVRITCLIAIFHIVLLLAWWLWSR